jgi:hypothetical protein
MNLRDLARAVPVHVLGGRRYFVRIGEIPDPLRRQFTEALRGPACPVLMGEGPLAYAWDWEAWIEDRWTGRAGVKFSEILSAMPNVGKDTDFERRQSTSMANGQGEL